MVQSIRALSSVQMDLVSSLYTGVTRMHISRSGIALEARLVRRRDANAEASEVTNPLESLPDCSIRMRDLYRYARPRMSGGASRILAGAFLQDPQLSWGPGTRHAPIRMLRTLLDAHEAVLSVAPAGSGDERKDEVWIRDLAVGQVVLANEQQSQSIFELLGSRCNDPRMSIPFQWNSD
jgi:hypothetical protein